MKRILLLDTETTGTNKLDHHVVEIAAILYSIEHRAPIVTYAGLVPGIENEAAEFNGIHPSLLKQSVSLGTTCAVLDEMQMNADAIVAHSAQFDYDFVKKEEYWGFDWDRLPWICSMRHIKWPRKIANRNLVALALAHGVPIVGAHRALTDSDILARLFTRVAETGTDLEHLLEQAMRPRALVEALTTKAQKDLTYFHGFDWDPDERKTLREMPPEDIADLPFKCRILKPAPSGDEP
jgi:DNA polymerase-3 subunit epsilon